VKRILLVEDEPGLVLTLTDRLTREGYAVESAADGEAGLERASREPFDLLLLDLMLPRMSGFDVCRELRRRSIETPVIMLTARGAVVDKVVGLKLGADDYVTKPFEMAELLARVEAHLRRTPAAPHPTEGYAFGDVRVATFALPTLTQRFARFSGGVVIARFSGHTAVFRNSLTVRTESFTPCSTSTRIRPGKPPRTM